MTGKTGYSTPSKKQDQGFVNLVEPKAVPSSDCYDDFSDKYFSVVGRLPAPIGYSGRVPPRSYSERLSWRKCLELNGMPKEEGNNEQESTKEND